MQGYITSQLSLSLQKLLLKIDLPREKRKRKLLFEIPGEMLEELRELGFSWIKIGEILGVSRWTIHRRVEEYGLQNMTGFHYLAD